MYVHCGGKDPPSMEVELISALSECFCPKRIQKLPIALETAASSLRLDVE